MIDIDHFKRINDTYGHDIGDIVLSQLSSVLKNNVRHIDFVSRMGGEEFSVLLPDCCYIEALDIAEKIAADAKFDGDVRYWNTAWDESEAGIIAFKRSLRAAKWLDITLQLNDIHNK